MVIGPKAASIAATAIEEVGSDRHVEDDADDPPRPGREFRSEADREISAAISRFRRQDISMYARGMSVREIRGHLEDLYGIDVSADLVSAVTDAVLEEVAEWQNRPLDACYALVFFDAIRVKIRDEGFVRNKAVYIALGIRPDGTKEILGIWIEQTEGAKFWLRVMNELKPGASVTS